LIIKRDGGKCRVCGSEKYLHVHHRQYHYSRALRNYLAPWEYTENLLITLCKMCHERGHSKYNVPVKKVG
jgi:5-methylcytosine-specific restriction endonuclease McrA